MDLFLKPEELSLFHHENQGGLGLEHVWSKCTASMIKNFLQMATKREFSNIPLAATIYEQQIENIGCKCVKSPPFYTSHMFKEIRL